MVERPIQPAAAWLGGGSGGGGSALLVALRRLVLIAGALGVLALCYGVPLAGGLTPLFVGEIGWLDDTFRVERLDVDHHDGADAVFRVEVGLAHRLVVNGHIIDPDPRGTATASTLVGHAIVPAIVLLAIALAWPAGGVRSCALRVLATLPAVMLLWMVDVPLILLASLWKLVFQTLEPNRFSVLWVWAAFLQGGGELALAAALGGMIGSLGGRRVAHRPVPAMTALSRRAVKSRRTVT